jgi:pimeloyl-ACP methyl ester carboxylesterase
VHQLARVAHPHHRKVCESGRIATLRSERLRAARVTPEGTVLRFPRLPTPFVHAIEPPRAEGVVRVGRRRVLGYAEYGDENGRLVLWHHGTPGARGQIPMNARRAAERLGLRLVCVERPGVGDSTNHRYATFADWTKDAAKVVDHFGAAQFAVVGLSGGGPYALACAHDLSDRDTVVGLLGSVCPIAGPDAAPGSSIVNLAAKFQGLLDPMRSVLGVGVWLALQPVVPLGHFALQLYSSRMPKGDQAVFADPEMEAMFIDDIVNASRRRFGAIAHDAALFGRPWGFNLADIEAPVFWWHGDADNIVPLAHAEHSIGLLRACEFEVRPEESHLGAFAAADRVLETLANAWGSGASTERRPAASPSGNGSVR